MSRRLAWILGLFWLAIAAGVGAWIGKELDWGRRLHATPPPLPVLKAVPVTVAALPDYSLPGGVNSYDEIANRVLFNPTRRPAPPAPPPPTPEPPKPQMRKGQFQLMGTTITDDRRVALLRELSSGKTLRVAPGQTLNGMNVENVETSRVVFSFAGDTEELGLKVATGGPRAAPAQQQPPRPATQNPQPQQPPPQPPSQPQPRADAEPVTPPPAVAAGAMPDRRRGRQAFVTAPPTDPAVQAARDAQSQQEWRALEQRIRESMKSGQPPQSVLVQPPPQSAR